GDPDRVAVEEPEEVRLRCIEPPHEERALRGARQHQQPQRALPPSELDAGSRVPRDLARKLADGDASWSEPHVVHDDEGDHEDRCEESRANEVREGQIDLAEETTPDRSDEHRGSRDLLTSREDAVEQPAV